MPWGLGKSKKSAGTSEETERKRQLQLEQEAAWLDVHFDTESDKDSAYEDAPDDPAPSPAVPATDLLPGYAAESSPPPYGNQAESAGMSLLKRARLVRHADVNWHAVCTEGSEEGTGPSQPTLFGFGLGITSDKVAYIVETESQQFSRTLQLEEGVSRRPATGSTTSWTSKAKILNNEFLVFVKVEITAFSIRDLCSHLQVALSDSSLLPCQHLDLASFLTNTPQCCHGGGDFFDPDAFLANMKERLGRSGGFEPLDEDDRLEHDWRRMPDDDAHTSTSCQWCYTDLAIDTHSRLALYGDAGVVEYVLSMGSWHNLGPGGDEMERKWLRAVLPNGVSLLKEHKAPAGSVFRTWVEYDEA